jgi:hypothetical protein
VSEIGIFIEKRGRKARPKKGRIEIGISMEKRERKARPKKGLVSHSHQILMGIGTQQLLLLKFLDYIGATSSVASVASVEPRTHPYYFIKRTQEKNKFAS